MLHEDPITENHSNFAALFIVYFCKPLCRRGLQRSAAIIANVTVKCITTLLDMTSPTIWLWGSALPECFRCKGFAVVCHYVSSHVFLLDPSF